jgi:hypothetical protein
MNKYWFFTALYFFLTPSIAQEVVLEEINSKAAYPFLLHVPKSVSNEKLPVVIFLHGRSLSGTDLNLVKRYGILDAMKRGKRIDAFVIAPQVKKSESWNPDKLLDVLNYVQKNYQTDTTRVYVVGMSLGGYGTLHFAGKYPHRVAAAVAMCGGGNTKDACNLGKTNIWIQHGKQDKAVPYSQSLEIFEAISSCTPQGECILTLHPNYDHGEISQEFYKDALYDWLFQFKLGQIATIEVEKPLLKPIEEKGKAIVLKDNVVSESSTEMSKKINTEPKKVYTVKKGDTLSMIARKQGISLENLFEFNGLNASSILQIGQKIRVK